MRAQNTRVTARMRRTPEGEVHREYVAGNIAYGSIEALQAALEGR